MSDDTADEFRLVSIDFADDPMGAACFSFGPPDAGGPYSIEVDLDARAPDLEEALAMAAESAAADLRAWAQEAEDFAARARAGRLRQPQSSP